VTGALRAEWTKLRTLPDVLTLLLAAVVLTAGVAAAATATGGAVLDPVHLSLLGVQLGQAVVAAAGVQIMAGEYAHGLIGRTLAAVPRRGHVLAAKAVPLTVGTALAAVVAVLASVVLGWRLLPSFGNSAAARCAEHLPVPPPSCAAHLYAPAVLAAAGGSVLYLILIALLGLGVAAIVRNAAAALGVVLGLLYLVPAMLRMFGDQDWQRALYRIAPSTAGLTVQTTVDRASLPMGPWAGLAVTAAWAAGALTVGALILRRRDAG
jgi:ABC-2 type transport system permease protein